MSWLDDEFDSNELESLGFFEWLSETHNLSDTDMKPEYLDELPLNDIHRTVCNSMVFRWFREKHNLLSLVFKDEIHYWFEIERDIHQECTSKGFKTYEEAESACIDKLIEILKDK